MDAREDLTRLVDAFGRAGAQCVESAAAGTIDAGEPEDVDRHAAVMPEAEPTLFRGNATAAALAGWQQLGGFVDPAAAEIAIDPRRRQIGEPRKSRQCRDVVAVPCEHGVACSIGGNRDEEMGDPIEHPRVDGLLAVEESGGKARLPQHGCLLGAAAGAGYHPPRRDETAGERQRAVAKAEAEEMRPGHEGCRTGVAAGSASSVSAIRFCLKRLSAQKPQETSAPTASGRRSPKLSLREPISTAPTAGPARKIMP